MGARYGVMSLMIAGLMLKMSLALLRLILFIVLVAVAVVVYPVPRSSEPKVASPV